MTLKEAPGAVRRGMKAAEKAAWLSKSPSHRVGAAIFKGTKLVSYGWNSRKSHPRSHTIQKGHHAEFAALMANWKYDLIGATIYVTRLTRGGNIGIAAPCKECRKLIEACGLKRVVFTNREGEVEEWRL